MNEINKKILKIVFIILVGIPISLFLFVKIEGLILNDTGGYGNGYRNPKLRWLFDFFFDLNNYRYRPNNWFSLLILILGLYSAKLLITPIKKLFNKIER